MDVKRILEDAASLDSLLNTVPFHFLLPAGADDAAQSAAHEKRLDPKLVLSSSQKLRDYLSKQQPRGKRKGAKGGSSGGTREELEAKLHSRIDELREKRRQEQSARDKVAAEARGEAPRGVREPRDKSAKGSPRTKTEVEFGNIGLNTKKADLSVPEMAPAAAGSKKRKLQQQLAAADAQRAKLQKVSGDDKDGVRHGVAMKQALQRAQGEKVHDNTTKLRKALKGIEMKKQKSQHKWDERVKGELKTRDESAKKKAENLKTKRARGKKDFKEAQAAKKEKEQKEEKEQKNRAGFEGKRKGYINSA